MLKSNFQQRKSEKVKLMLRTETNVMITLFQINTKVIFV